MMGTLNNGETSTSGPRKLRRDQGQTLAVQVRRFVGPYFFARDFWVAKECAVVAGSGFHGGDVAGVLAGLLRLEKAAQDLAAPSFRQGSHELESGGRRDRPQLPS